MVRVRGGGGVRYMCEYGQRGVLSAKPRSGRVKQVGVWGRCELGCKDGGNVIFWFVLKTYKRHYLEINVKEMKHFDDHSRMKKM